MAAISDLDVLLGDLEKTCQAQGQNGKSEEGPAAGSPLTSNGGPVEPDRTAPEAAGANQLDEMLRDLAAERYGSNVHESVKNEAKAVVREMKFNSKAIEKKMEERGAADGPNVESQWEYRGYGIWETSKTGEGRSPFLDSGGLLPKGNPNQLLTMGGLREALRDAEEQRTTSRGVDPRASSVSPPSAASSATQELDDLMLSLNTFKVVGAAAADGVPEAAAAPGEPTLDGLLGDLRVDMDKQGVKVTQKGCCAACSKVIAGQVVTALGRTWHPEHFLCAHCGQELTSVSFFEREGRPYCEDDYQKLFSPRCARCGEAVLDKCVTALDRTWHPGCFVCAGCRGDFGEDGFHERDGEPYCRGCFFDRFAPRCAGCREPILENYVSCLDGQWHPACFVCAECRQPFPAGNFFEHDGRPYCENHYHALRGSLCAGCRKPISGRCITAMFKKFHPEHFVCSFCLKQLNKGTFKERGEKPYCHECHDRLFG